MGETPRADPCAPSPRSCTLCPAGITPYCAQAPPSCSRQNVMFPMSPHFRVFHKKLYWISLGYSGVGAGS